MLPVAVVEAAAIEITGVVVPVATAMGAVPVTLVTVPEPPPPPEGALVHAVPFQV